MDWMYKKNPNEVDPEEYLLGRAIDKNYLKQPSPENYMRSIRNEGSSSRSQTDLTRKTLEDPLTMIKQKEIEKKKLLLQRTHLKFPDGVPINIISDNQVIKQPKSLIQLIVENQRKLSTVIDIEKLYKRVKSKKKRKKNKRDEDSYSNSKSGMKKRKKQDSSSSDSDSDDSEPKQRKNRDEKRSDSRRKHYSDSNNRKRCNNTKQPEVRNRRKQSKPTRIDV